MYRYLLAVIGLGIVFTVAACSDTEGGGGKGPGAGSGATGLTRGGGEPDVATKPAPEVEKGVVPDVVGVSLGDAQPAIKEAGFKEVEISGGVGVGTVFPPSLVICSQEPEAGSTPKKGTAVDLVAETSCE